VLVTKHYAGKAGQVKTLKCIGSVCKLRRKNVLNVAPEPVS
jgi:hypothetical protein